MINIFEARIRFENGTVQTIEAVDIGILREKCRPFIKKQDVYEIWVVKIEGVGWFKSELAPVLSADPIIK